MLARFAIDKGKISKDAVKPKAFEPNRESQVSVFFITDLTCPEVIEIGKKSAKRSLKSGDTKLSFLVGRAFRCSMLKGTDLRIETDDTCDYGDHANILGWPSDAELRMRLQIELAGGSLPVRIPTVLIAPNPIASVSS